MKYSLIAISTVTTIIGFSSSVFATEWDVSLWGKRRAFTEHVEKLAELVDHKTGGKFKLKITYGDSSKKHKENLDGVSSGAFQMAQFCVGHHPKKTPSLTVLELPFLGVEALEQEAAISMAVYKHPAVVKDLERLNAVLLMPTPLPQYNLAGTEAPPKSIAEYKRLKVSHARGNIALAMQELGAVIIPNIARVYQGNPPYNAVPFAPHAHMNFGIAGTAKWWTTNLNPGTAHCPIAVNGDALNSLSQDERKALLGSVDEAMTHYLAYYNDNILKKWLLLLEKRGIEKITYDHRTIIEIRNEVAVPAEKMWVKNNKKRGLPAQDILDFVKSEIAKNTQ